MNSIEPYTAEAIASHLESYIRNNFDIDEDDPEFTREVNLWEEGYVDSIGVIEVVAYIEKTWKVSLTEEVLFSPDFTYIRGMSLLILSLTKDA